MPRRVYTYPRGLGWDTLNLLSSVGVVVLALGLAVVVVTVGWTLARGEHAPDDPWGAPTLEWTGRSLSDGRRVVETSALEAQPERILVMPSESLLPIALAAALTAVAVGLILESWVTAGAAGVAVALVLAAWHRPLHRVEDA
jgi:heme/copper-type cytochrome/quinol oxidase subunit 1